MKTTIGNLFNNTGILSHAGTYAGEYMQEAWDILDKAYTLPEFQGHMWADIMHNNDGQCYAVFAEDSLTCWNASCIYLEVSRSDCPAAYDNAQTHLIEP